MNLLDILHHLFDAIFFTPSDNILNKSDDSDKDVNKTESPYIPAPSGEENESKGRSARGDGIAPVCKKSCKTEPGTGEKRH